MKIRLTALSIGVMTLLAACGGSSMTLEEYFTKIEGIQQTANDESSKALEDISSVTEPPATPEEARDLYLPILESFTEIAQDAADSASAIDPPGDVADAHEAYVSAVEAQAEFFAGVRDELRAEGSDAEAVMQEASADGEGLSTATTAACDALQKAADGEGIEVDLQCEEVDG